MSNRPNLIPIGSSDIPIYIEKLPSTEIQKIRQNFGPFSAMELEDPNGRVSNLLDGSCGADRSP